jgi:hypothetical protein
MNNEQIAVLKDALARANSLYNKNVQGLISLNEESLEKLNNILNELNSEIDKLS